MLHIIFNPVAGKKNALKKLRAAQGVFDEKGVEYDVHATDDIGSGERLAKLLSEQGERDFVVVGGDGTLHEVLNGLSYPSVCRLGLIPAGTGNDFAAALGLPNSAEKAALRIAANEPQETDYLQVGNRRCMNVAGIGMDVDVLERCARSRSTGKRKYLKNLFSSVFSFQGHRVRVESGAFSKTFDALLAVACNGSQFGGGVRICPTAEPSDHEIDVVLVEKKGGTWQLIRAFWKLLRGKILTYKETTRFRCERMTVTPLCACASQLDGELYENNPFIVELKRGLQFFR